MARDSLDKNASILRFLMCSSREPHALFFLLKQRSNIPRIFCSIRYYALKC